MTPRGPTPDPCPRPKREVSTREAIYWMLFLGPFFLIVYFTCAWFTSNRPDVRLFYWQWERMIPFLPLFIIPYMSLDGLYVASVFLCRERRELHTLAKRMVFSISVAAVCFLAMPLKFAFPRPALSGWQGVLASALRVDKPYNLVPSLHVALLLILWAPYGRFLTGRARLLMKVWFCLIFASTVFTYQHHVIDLIGGLALALVTLYLIPEHEPGWMPVPRETERPNGRLAAGYAGVAALLFYAAQLSLIAAPVWEIHWGVLLCWPALSLSLVAFGYWRSAEAVFQKQEGRLSLASQWLLAPFRFGLSLWKILFTAGMSPYTEIAPNIMIGARLSDREAAGLIRSGVTAVVDLTAEFSETPALLQLHYRNFPLLDFAAPSPEWLRDVVSHIREISRDRKVYIHCTLGVSRSVGVAAAYLLEGGLAHSAEHAVEQIRKARGRVRIGEAWMESLQSFHGELTVPGASEFPALSD